MADQDQRTFTIATIEKNNKKLNFEGGRYTGKTPAGAARKSIKRACQEFGGSGTYKVTLRETTIGSSKKAYVYEGKRESKEPEQVGFKGGSNNVVQFKNYIHVKSLNQNRTAPTAPSSTKTVVKLVGKEPKKKEKESKKRDHKEGGSSGSSRKESKARK